MQSKATEIMAESISDKSFINQFVGVKQATNIHKEGNRKNLSFLRNADEVIPKLHAINIEDVFKIYSVKLSREFDRARYSGNILFHRSGSFEP
jgi:hypothetical protein